jgi:hypothetical protein
MNCRAGGFDNAKNLRNRVRVLYAGTGHKGICRHFTRLMMPENMHSVRSPQYNSPRRIRGPRALMIVSD